MPPQADDAVGGVFRPAIPGCSVATPGRQPGTFGCVVRDTSTAGSYYILSAAHVIANSTFDPLGLPVFQPGGSAEPGSVIGILTRWGALQFTPDTFPNLFDAAVARVQKEHVRPEIHGIGRPRGVTTTYAKGTKVRKCGTTTGVTYGVVEDPNYHCYFYYTDPSGNTHRAGFQQQILCVATPQNGHRPFSEGGDSGSVVLDDEDRVVGLIVGAGAGGTIVSPIAPILHALKVFLA